MSLEFLGIQYFGVNLKTLSPLDREDLESEPLESVLRYNGIDAKYHRLLYMEQFQRLAAEDLVPVYRRHVARIPATVRTQIKGVPIAPRKVEQLDTKYSERCNAAMERIRSLPAARRFLQTYRREYNPGSAPDGRKMLQLIGGGYGSADEEAFSRVSNPIGKAVIAYRKNAKVLSTYISPLFDNGILFPDGLLHPIISTCMTRTSRSSSLDPNIQNWPKHQGELNEVRAQIEAPPGYKVVALDYSGIQARNVAMESLDRKLIEAFHNRYDIHMAWAETLTRKYPSWIKEGAREFASDKKIAKAYRQKTKNKFVFPSFFGAGAGTVSAGLGVPKEIAQWMLNCFWSEFPDIKGWHEQLRADYDEYGYITGLSGYRRQAPVAYTEQINTPIQADEAVIVFDAWIQMAMDDDEDLCPILMIHDDLSFLWPENRLDDLADKAIALMTNPRFEWAHVVPIEVEMSVGDNWYEMSDAGKFSSDGEGGYVEID
jgi:hypothetical protein